MERHRIVEMMTQPEYSALPPCEVVPMLADLRTYLASESTGYLVLQEQNLQYYHRRASDPAMRQITTHVATRPSQVYMWDITYLNDPIKEQFYYLTPDLFSH